MRQKTYLLASSSHKVRELGNDWDDTILDEEVLRDAVQRFPLIRFISCKGIVEDDTVIALSKCSSLRRLYLESDEIACSRAVWDAFAAATPLRHLSILMNLELNGVRDCLPVLPHLEHLTISYMPRSFDGIESMRRLKCLELNELDWENVAYLRSSNFQQIAQCSQLQSLQVDFYSRTGSGLDMHIVFKEAVKKLVCGGKLRSLTLRGKSDRRPPVLDINDLEQLGICEPGCHLEELVLRVIDLSRDAKNMLQQACPEPLLYMCDW